MLPMVVIFEPYYIYVIDTFIILSVICNIGAWHVLCHASAHGKTPADMKFLSSYHRRLLGSIEFVMMAERWWCADRRWVFIEQPYTHIPTYNDKRHTIIILVYVYLPTVYQKTLHSFGQAVPLVGWAKFAYIHII